MKQKHSVTIEELGITINTGSIARLANGAVTISNQLAEVYIASDHEVTTTSGSNGYAGRVWDVNGDGVWVQSAWLGQNTF